MVPIKAKSNERTCSLVSFKKVALVSSSLSIAAAGMTLPMTAANASTDPGTRAGDTVKISGPKKAKVNKRFDIACQANSDQAGFKVLLWQNGSKIKLKKLRVGSDGSCNFWFDSGVLGRNKLDVAVKKGRKIYQSNSIVVKVKPRKGQQLGAKVKNAIKLKGPKKGKLEKKIKLKCQASTALAGGKITLYQNGSILPQVSKFKVGSDGSCNFWIKSGIIGPNTIDMAVKKSKKHYQSNAVTVMVS